jgi:hypothetical protein
MVAVVRGRRTHEHDAGLVVFLIGMRVNRPIAVRAWWPVFTAMPRMLAELRADPSSGLLGATLAVQGRGALCVQYWRDAESLLAYAHDPQRGHRPAWQQFNRTARSSGGAVGIWHETFVVAPGGHESRYVDMPEQGLPAIVSAARPSGPPGPAAPEPAPAPGLPGFGAGPR